MEAFGEQRRQHARGEALLWSLRHRYEGTGWSVLAGAGVNTTLEHAGLVLEQHHSSTPPAPSNTLQQLRALGTPPTVAETARIE